MQRPRLILALAALQLVLGLVYMGGAIFLIHLTTTPEITNDKDAADAIQGILIAAAVAAAFGFGTLLSSFGLWLVEKWGRWLAIALNGLAAVFTIYNLLDQSSIDWDEVAAPVMLLMALIPFLFPAVGRALAKPLNSTKIPDAIIEGPHA